MKLKYPVIFILLNLVCFQNITAQAPQLSNLSIDLRTGLPRYAEVSSHNGLTESTFFNWFNKNYHLVNGVEFKLLRSDVDELGYTHSRYKQYYNGIEVLHSMLIVHSKNGFVESFNGECFNLFPETTNTITEGQAREYALNSYGNNYIGKWQIPQEEALIKQIKNNPEATWYPNSSVELYAYPEYYDGKNALVRCYSFEIALFDPNIYQQVLVNSQTGKIYRTIPLEVHTDSAGKAVTHYEGTKDITADFVTTNSFRLRENGKRKVETYKNAIGTDYTDADNNWNNGTDKIAGDVHYGAELVSDYMKIHHNKNSYDDNGGALISVTSGGSGNAFWSLGSNYATFLVGTSGSVGPCAALDVVGHEFGHGIADEISGLAYSGEACALHESFADINGHNTEWMNDSTKANWWIGEKVWPSSNGIRYLKNPFVFNNPKAYGGQYFPQGCHGSGGVQNYWYYIQVAGDTAKNEFNYSYSLKGLGHKKANQILYRSMFYYMIPNAKFSDQYIGTLKAAKDLFGSCSPELEHTYKAWKAVNVEDTSVKTVDLSHGIKAPTLICTGAPTSATLASFGDISRTVFWLINKIDTSSKRSFSYAFKNTGSYQVKLLTTTCGKSFADSMYITVNYTPKPAFDLPFDSACASNSKVTFTNKTINTDSKIPLKYYWYVNPGALSDTFKNLVTTFPLAMDYEIQLKAYYEGGCWAIIKKLITVLEAPDPKFTVLKDVCETRPVKVRNLTDTFNKNVTFEWIFPDASIVKSFEPKNKSITSAGQYNLILKAIYPYGGCSDTAIRQIRVLPNPQPDFTYKNNCQGLNMTVYSGGKYFAPKEWTQWHFGYFNPYNKDTFLLAASDSAARIIGLTIADSSGCFASKYKSIVLEKLKATATASKVCYGDSTVLQTSVQNSEPFTQKWKFGDGSETTNAVAKHYYTTPGKFQAEFTVNSKSCSDKIPVMVEVWTAPQINFIGSDVCDGDTVHFKNLTNGRDTTDFNWNFGDNQTATKAQVSHLYLSGVTRTYNVYLEGKYNNGCVGSQTKQVTVYELPKCEFSATYDQNAGNNGFNFTPSVMGYTSYLWNFGDGETSNTANPFHRFKSNGNYTVTLIAKNSAGCECYLNTVVSAAYSGISKYGNAEFNIYPNPAEDYFIIENSIPFKYQIMDTKGAVIKSDYSKLSTQRLSTKDFVPGIYIVQLTTDNAIQTVQLIIQ